MDVKRLLNNFALTYEFKKSIFTFAAAFDDTFERAENPKDT